MGLAGRRVPPAELAYHAHNAGWYWWMDQDLLRTAVAVALGESEGYCESVNGAGADLSYGLWQINMKGRLGPERRNRWHLSRNEDLFNPATNAMAAFDLFLGRGRTFLDWGAYKDGGMTKYGRPTRAREGVAQFMAYSVKSLMKLLAELNEKFPHRSKASDGWIGDARHAASHSDHNPEPDGTVDARDFTHDPVNGADMYKIRQLIYRDPRISYIIFAGHIFNPAIDRELPGRPYSGSNGHYHHMHVSVKDAGQNNEATWFAQKGDLSMAEVTRNEFDALVATLHACWKALYKADSTAPGGFAEHLNLLDKTQKDILTRLTAIEADLAKE